MRATDGILQSLMLRAGGKGWPVPALVVGSIYFVAALSLFLFIRRAMGALTAPLATSQLFATAVVMCLWAVVVREFTAKRAIYFWISLGTMLLVAIACSFPTARLVDWLVWIPAMGCVAVLPFAARLLPSAPSRSNLRVVESEPDSEQVLQQLTRVRTADGKDAIRGILAAEFNAGERQTTLYVGFCPPFERLPEVETNVADDFEVDVKLVQVLHNGAQIDVRLGETAEEPMTVSIEFFAIEAV